MVAINIRPPLNKTDRKNFLAQCQRHRCTEQTPFFDAQTTTDLLFYIVNGSIAITATRDSGRTINIANLRTGDFFCQTDLSSSDNIKSIQIQASENCDVATISYSRLKQLVSDSPEYTALLSPMMAKRILD